MSDERRLLSKIRAVLESVDPNIGVVVEGSPRWATIGEVEREGSILLRDGSAIDPVTDAGRRVARFWSMKVSREDRPITNASIETRFVVAARIFVAQDGDAEGIAREIVGAALARLQARETERESLDLGDGYEGFLEERPRQTSPVEVSILSGADLVGYSAEIEITVYRETPV